MNYDYLINFKEIADESIVDIIHELKSRNGLKISDCLISHLVYYDNRPILYGNGVYIFKDGDDFVYVGSCSARNFVERVPAHFDVRKSAWFNSLPKSIIKKRKEILALEEAVKYAFDNCSLLIINFEVIDGDINWEKDVVFKIKKLESLLIKELNSYNNKNKHYASLGSIKLKEYLSQFS